MIKKIIVPLFNSWMEDSVEPCDWRNWKRFENYFASVTMNEEGKEDRIYMPESSERDLFFCVKDLHEGDIAVASRWDKRKSRQRKNYYIVLSKTTTELILCSGYGDIDFSTYRKTFKVLHSPEFDAELQSMSKNTDDVK